jgi:hypothetical protein
VADEDHFLFARARYHPGQSRGRAEAQTEQPPGSRTISW